MKIFCIRLTLFLLLCIATAYSGYAQNISIPPGEESYHLLDRWEIKYGLPQTYHSALKSVSRKDITTYALQVEKNAKAVNKLDQSDIQYIFNDNNEWVISNNNGETTFKKVYVDSAQIFYSVEETEDTLRSEEWRYKKNNKPLFKVFYKTPANFFEVNQESFYLKVNPVLNAKIGFDSKEKEIIFYNTRGLSLRGGIDNKVFFYSNIHENQARFPNYINHRIDRDKAVPGSGFYKNFNSTIFNIDNGYDFLNAQAYIGFNITKHIGLQFGHGKNFIGNGYRTFFLSDYSNNYLYLKLNTNVWKFHYQNLFTELSAQGSKDNIGNNLLPKKYMVAHYLSFKANQNLELGVFESVVFARNNQFELNYLNPVILYRTVEGLLDGPDNVLLGLDAKWNFLHRYQLYTQLMMDEFKFDELFLNKRGWWGNKYAIQAGIKAVDLFNINHLDARIEFNVARPYTYTHRDSSASYSHYNQPLAHPLGANFKEYIFTLRYQPLPKVVLNSRLLYFDYGEDTPDANWGNNILTPYTSRLMDFNNQLGQGVAAETMIFGLDISWMFMHNFYFDIHYLSRTKNSSNEKLNMKTNYLGAGIRINFANPNVDF